MDYSSSTCTREHIRQLRGLARLQRARFLGQDKKHKFFGIKSCAVKIGEKMLKFAYS